MRTKSRSRRRGLVLAVLTLIVRHAGAGASATVRAVSAGADQAAARTVRSGRSGLQDLQGKVLRISPALLAAVPRGLGLPEPREAGRRKVVPRTEAEPRSECSDARSRRHAAGRPARSSRGPCPSRSSRWSFAVRPACATATAGQSGGASASTRSRRRRSISPIRPTSPDPAPGAPRGQGAPGPRALESETAVPSSLLPTRPFQSPARGRAE